MGTAFLRCLLFVGFNVYRHAAIRTCRVGFVGKIIDRSAATRAFRAERGSGGFGVVVVKQLFAVEQQTRYISLFDCRPDIVPDDFFVLTGLNGDVLNAINMFGHNALNGVIQRYRRAVKGKDNRASVKIERGENDSHNENKRVFPRADNNHRYAADQKDGGKYSKKQ